MAKRGSPDVFLLVDGYNISGDTIEMEQIKETLPPERTDGMGDSWTEYTHVGIKGGGINHRCLYDDAALATNAALTGSIGISRILLAGYEGNTKGQKCSAFQGAMETKIARMATRGELHKISAEYLTNGAIDEPTIIQVLAAQSAAGAGSSGSSDNGAGTSNGGVFYVQVPALTLGGYTSVTIVLQHSSDNGGADPWATLVGCTITSTSAPDKARVEVAAGTTVDRYLRANVTWNGAGSGQSVTYVVAFQRN